MAERSRPSVLITGAAAGIGAATARRFAAGGWLVGLYDIDRAGATRVATEINSGTNSGINSGGPGAGAALAGQLDVTDVRQWEDALDDFVQAAGGRLDLLVNNAGILRGGRFADVPLAEHQRTVEVNVGGVLNGCHTAHRYLRATPGAMVINLCSASAIYGQAELASYSASKFAVRGLTEALELEWRKEGIKVRAVWPLFVETAMIDGLAIGSTDSLGITLTPEDVADQIWSLARRRAGAGRFLPSGVHTAVGLRAKFMAGTASMAPSFVTRAVNRRITRS